MIVFRQLFLLLLSSLLLTACGFHLQGERRLSPPLNRMVVLAPDPYGQLVRSLRDYLKMSHVQLVARDQASVVLNITQDDTSQELLSVSGTQQTRQYILKVTVTFEITTPVGMQLLPPQTLSESRTLTVQSNQVLGSTNEANLFYQQMRRTLAYNIINRLASYEVTRALHQSASS